MLENRHVPVQRIGLSDFRHSNIDWSTYDLTAPTTPILFDKRQLRPHQHKALQAALEGFEANDRGKLIMASAAYIIDLIRRIVTVSLRPIRTRLGCRRWRLRSSRRFSVVVGRTGRHCLIYGSLTTMMKSK